MQLTWFRRLALAALMLPALLTAQTLEEARTTSNEGMWLPFKIEQNIEHMQSLGFQLGADKVYNEESNSLHQGIVKLNGGSCTAEMISDQGLVLTNHHCAYDAIATLSSEENDLLTNGFWSESFEEELPIPGGTAAYLIHSADVTDRLVEDGKPITNLESAMGEIEEEVREEMGLDADYYEIDIQEMFHGAEYYLFVYKVYSDVRLVGAPPSSIGKFGHDTDNWMWPRHTGDFAILRVYADENNEPVDYAEDNKPYTPDHYFPISLEGVEELDYAMIMGYPGTTTRYLTASDIQLALEQTNGDRIHLLGEKTRIMKSYMDQSDATRIALASDYASLMNYYKYLIGQTTMMERYDVVGKREKEEEAFQAWVEADEEREEAYGDLLEDMAELNGNYQQVDQFMSYLNFGIFGADAATYALDYLGMTRVLASDDADAIAEATEDMKAGLADHFANYRYEMDQEIFTSSLLSYYNNVPESMHPPIFDQILNPVEPEPEPVVEETPKERRKRLRRERKLAKLGISPEAEEVVEEVVPEPTDQEKLTAWADMVFETSIFTDEARMDAFLSDPSAEALNSDPMMAYMQDVIGFFRSRVGMAYGVYNSQIDGLRRTYLQALREMHADKEFYPDANSTMRLTYGRVLAYEPADGVFYNYYTTLAGVMEKEDPDDEEFIVPAKLKQLYESENYGRYADEDGTMHVCFLTNNDITGGNSGSPVLNDRGQLIGCAFDGNWESMSSDIYIFPQFNRTIAVDIRYVLFIVDKYAGAQRLIDEMTIVDGTE